ncbi:MAG: DMT family transporter [Polyangia bacterium]
MNRAPLGVLTILLTLLGWSSIPLFQKHFSHTIDAWTSNGWRYGFSALLWMPALIYAQRRGTLPTELWTAALWPSLFNTLGQVAFTWAFYLIDPGLGTFGLRLQIVFVTLGAAALFESERRIVRRPGFVLGLMLVTFGTLGTLLLGTGFGQRATLLGVLVAISSGVIFAGYALSVRRFMHGMQPLTAFAAISLYTAIGSVVLMLLLGERHGATVFALPKGLIGQLLLSSVIGIGLGHTLYYASIARLGVAVSAGVIQLQPFLVAAASFFLFGERLSALQWGCGSLAVLGAATILLVQQRACRTAPPELSADEAPLPKLRAASS